MMITFNKDKYKDLLSEYQPKLIKTELENEQALAMIEKLMHLSNRTVEQQELYELLIVLVEKFEQEFYQPNQHSDPVSMLLFLIEQQEMPPSKLVNVFGSQVAVEDVISEKVSIDRSIANSLGQLFHVDPNLFL